MFALHKGDLTHTPDRLRPAALPFRKRSALVVSSLCASHNEPVLPEHNAQSEAKMHHLSERLPQHRLPVPPAAHIQPSHARLGPPEPGVRNSRDEVDKFVP